jgi:hypothetical protein
MVPANPELPSLDQKKFMVAFLISIPESLEDLERPATCKLECSD